MPPENTLGRLQYSLKLAFYNRATLCVSAVLLSPGVCPSVRFVHSVHTAEDIVKLLCRPGSRIILDFLMPSAATRLQGEPIQQGRKVQGVWENFAIFDWNRRLSWKRYEIGLYLLWNVNRKTYALCQMVTFSTTLTYPFPGFKVTAYLKSSIS